MDFKYPGGTAQFLYLEYVAPDGAFILFWWFSTNIPPLTGLAGTLLGGFAPSFQRRSATDRTGRRDMSGRKRGESNFTTDFTDDTDKT